MMRNNDFYGLQSSSSDWSADEVSLSHYTMAQEPSNDFVLGSWQVEQPAGSENGSSLPSYDDDELMVVDSINMDFDDEEDLFPPTPPAGRLLLEEALEDTLDQHGDNDDDSFFSAHRQLSPSFSPANSYTSYLPVDQRYQATLEKLTESMLKSQETRKSLRIKTSETVEYNRWNSISGTLSSIEKSTQQLQQYLKHKNSTQQQVL